MQIVPLSAFSDNYIWAIVRGSRCAVVDPGAAAPVEAFVAAHALTLDHILITHHHDDHIGGLATLRAHHRVKVWGPEDARIGALDHVVAEGDVLHLDEGLALRVLAVPGHTVSHIAWYGGAYLFCGDTLFGAGCGRLFEGSAATMYASLQKLARLPPETLVCCAHEYTLTNLRFAQQVEACNGLIAQRRDACSALRAEGLPTLPSRLSEELATNPFLRCDHAAVKERAELHAQRALTDEVEVFAALRAWRNHF